MEIKNAFLEGTRRKLRFWHNVGNVGIEDLWDLSLKSLDEIYKDLNSKKEVLEGKSSRGESLFKSDKLDEETVKELEDIEIGIQVVTEIFNIKNRESKLALEEVVRAEKKKKLIDALAEKENEELRSMSKAEILEQIQNL